MSDDPIKPTTYRVYLPEPEDALMRAACERTELGQTELLSKLVKAGLHALADVDFRVTLPLRFTLEDSGSLMLRDAPPPPKKPRGK